MTWAASAVGNRLMHQAIICGPEAINNRTMVNGNIYS